MAHSSGQPHHVEDVERPQGVFGAGEPGAAHGVCLVPGPADRIHAEGLGLVEKKTTSSYSCLI